MAELLDGIDLSNPCLVWPKLQEAYYRRVAGQTEVKIRFDKEEVEFGSASPDAILAAITRVKADCERRSGRRGNFAIRGTHHRPR